MQQNFKAKALVCHSSQIDIVFANFHPRVYTHRRVEVEEDEETPQARSVVEADAPGRSALVPGGARPRVGAAVDGGELDPAPRAPPVDHRLELVDRKWVPDGADADRNPAAEGCACPVVSLVYSVIWPLGSVLGWRWSPTSGLPLELPAQVAANSARDMITAKM